MGSDLQSAFESAYSDGGSRHDDPRAVFLNRIEEELESWIPGGDGLEWQSNRPRLTVKGLYRLYVAVMRFKGESPELLYNGRSVLTRERFQELDEDGDCDSEALRRMWKNLGDDV